jgi:hypothetical protein
LPHTLALFECTLTVPTPPSEPASAKVAPELAGWSDAQLAQQLGQLMEEMQRRMGQGRRPELEAAARQACLLLKHLVPGSAKQDRPSKSAKTSPLLLQEGQRKAVRAALLAGVAPGQVAKHFGLPLAAVRKVLTDAA